jgi:hypothetical protein
MKRIVFILSILTVLRLNAQDSIQHWQFNGYAEFYAQYDANNPANNTRPAYVYSYNRNNELNLNLGYIRAAYTGEKLRAAFSLGAGTYMNANYAAEPGVLKNIYEANLGIKLSAKKEWWLDIGILPSHIGFESAIGKDNFTLSRSILADNSPYYETGARLSYTSADGKWYTAFLLLNGWQHIQRPDGQSLPAFGTQLTWKPSDALTLNSSSFIGTDKPDTARKMRYFHNFYGQLQFNKKWSAILGFDIGAEQQQVSKSKMNIWYSPVLMLRYASSEKTNFAFRSEYYRDALQVLINTNTANGFRTKGISLNVDRYLKQHLVWRNEIKYWNSFDKVFEKRDGRYTDQSWVFTTSFGLFF